MSLLESGTAPARPPLWGAAESGAVFESHHGVWFASLPIAAGRLVTVRYYGAVESQDRVATAIVEHGSWAHVPMAGSLLRWMPEEPVLLAGRPLVELGRRTHYTLEERS